MDGQHGISAAHFEARAGRERAQCAPQQQVAAAIEREILEIDDLRAAVVRGAQVAPMRASQPSITPSFATARSSCA